jgi:peptidoglycan hydrolase CwlO-like protein
MPVTRPNRTARRRALLAALGTAIALAVLAVLTLPASGQVSLSGQQAAAARLRAAVAAESRKISATGAGLADAQARLTRLEGQVSRRQGQVADAQDKLVRARIRLTKLQVKAALAQKTLAQNLVAAYKTPAPDLVGVAVEANGFQDLLEQLRFLNNVADRNASVLSDTRAAKTAVTQQAADLTDLRAHFSALAKAAIDDRDQADVLRNALLRRQEAQLRTRNGASAQLAQVRGRIASLEKAQAIAAQRAAQQESATAQAPTVPVTGPADATGAVAKVVAAANQIASTPYVWGGGHGGTASGGYDCSGSLSYALAAAGLVSSPLTSGGFMSWGLPGPGQHITVYANAVHTFMYVDGRRYDTSALSGGGTRWSTQLRSTAGFVARHPPGL